MLVSAIQWSESAVCVQISPSFWTSLPASSHPFGSSESTELSSLSSTSQGGKEGEAVGITASFSLKVSWGWICSISSRFSEITVSAALPAAAAAAKSLQLCPSLCDSIDEPTRLPRPWDSPGKNTGVGCHFLLQCLKVKSESEVAQSCPTPRDPMDCSLPGSSVYGIFQARVLEWVPLPSPAALLESRTNQTW